MHGMLLTRLVLHGSLSLGSFPQVSACTLWSSSKGLWTVPGLQVKPMLVLMT